ncbi:PEST proteolytic signal-containing nuclear protein-like isoform X2 [Phlebotomus papatasi]|uniref:PEST proteolytic signal-containing nuclear protein-like isoform X2 n=1 Tax=Phlebotomus papatasi TaxID=29031 RepID=UPI002484216A|nr:PEST proteolytic signal-containing nuclear protein-like isoform X2 [Phlebotomus papatasi]
MDGRYSDRYDRRGSYGSGSKRRSRSRSRSPSGRSHRRRYSSDEEDDNRYSSGQRSELRRLDEKDRNRSREKNSSPDDEAPVLPPPPPRISKVSMSFGKTPTPKPGIQMKLNPTGRSDTGKLTVASAFNADSDDEVEEMPAECRMRMRNIGRDTPTSSGPNSFGKTKQGFCDSKKIFEKTLRGTPEEDE